MRAREDIEADTLKNDNTVATERALAPMNVIQALLLEVLLDNRKYQSDILDKLDEISGKL